MRTRSAKKLAQRIDLYYFKHASPLRRWRTILSIAVPAAGLLWVGGMTAAGSRRAYSSGPVAAAHVFTESACEACHVRDASFRAHVSDNACLTCHDAPAHAKSKDAAPSCASCHREHQGRVALAHTPDDVCVNCHERHERKVGRFPADHPAFQIAADRSTLTFNHQVHLKKDLTGPRGPEQLECRQCHAPQLASARSSRAPIRMASPNYQTQCARCHPLFFDERLDVQAPHRATGEVYQFVERALREYIAAHPSEISKPDPPPRRLPLNFTLPPVPTARNADEWAARRLARADDVLRASVCGTCHAVRRVNVAAAPIRGQGPSGPTFDVATVSVASIWMPRARFDHRPHLMLDCTSCHDAGKSTMTRDAIMPPIETCATCHAPDKGAESRCFECHAYHDWSKEHVVAPRFKAGDFH